MSTVGFHPLEAASNPRIKEKLIKFIQYYNQFLVGYYTFHENSPDGLKKALKVQSLLSNCRKGIRFLKWIIHLNNALEKISIIKKMKEDGEEVETYQYFDVVNEVGNASYFIGDNRALFVNAGLLNRNKFIENCLYAGDFFADISGVISALLQLYDIPNKERKLKSRKQELITRIRSNISVIDASIHEEFMSIQGSIKALKRQKSKARYQLAQNGLQMISSANYDPIDLWRRLFGKKCPDTIVGLSGVVSSSVVMYYEWPRAEGTLEEEDDDDDDSGNIRSQIEAFQPNGEISK